MVFPALATLCVPERTDDVTLRVPGRVHLAGEREGILTTVPAVVPGMAMLDKGDGKTDI